MRNQKKKFEKLPDKVFSNYDELAELIGKIYII